MQWFLFQNNEEHQDGNAVEDDDVIASLENTLDRSKGIGRDVVI